MVLLIILHTKSKSRFKHILPSSESRWRISISPRHIQKKRSLRSSSLLSHKDSNLNKQDQNLLCYHYTMRQYSVNLGGLEPPTPTLSR